MPYKIYRLGLYLGPGQRQTLCVAARSTGEAVLFGRRWAAARSSHKPEILAVREIDAFAGIVFDDGTRWFAGDERPKLRGVELETVKSLVAQLSEVVGQSSASHDDAPDETFAKAVLRQIGERDDS